MSAPAPRRVSHVRTAVSPSRVSVRRVPASSVNSAWMISSVMRSSERRSRRQSMYAPNVVDAEAALSSDDAPSSGSASPAVEAIAERLLVGCRGCRAACRSCARHLRAEVASRSRTRRRPTGGSRLRPENARTCRRSHAVSGFGVNDRDRSRGARSWPGGSSMRMLPGRQVVPGEDRVEGRAFAGQVGVPVLHGRPRRPCNRLDSAQKPSYLSLPTTAGLRRGCAARPGAGPCRSRCRTGRSRWARRQRSSCVPVLGILRFRF